MSSFEKHCEESLRLFGKSFEEVHLWLDEYAGTPAYGYKHRKIRHHEKGVIEIVQLFGSEAGKAARQHIISDLMEEGWTENNRFPKDEQDYVKMGLY